MTDHQFVSYDSNESRLLCGGDWNLAHFPALRTSLKNISLSNTKNIILDGNDIQTMDSAGASLLAQWINHLKQKKIEIKLEHFSENHQVLLNFIAKELPQKIEIPTQKHIPLLESIGRQTIHQLSEFQDYLAFVGQNFLEALRILHKKTHIRWSAFASVIYQTGYQALPIIALLSFMIGVVIAYQMGVQLRNYGANVYIVDFLGLSVLREFGPLLTAIMVAGRTGSAFTAQLGLMKINQEVDALDTMGVTPSDLLILPRIAGLFISLPLLTMWADVFGIFGGLVMANNMLNLTWYDFLHRFVQVIPLRALLIGLGKAPVFALIIASVGCFQGMKVEGSAESVGRNTTKSVVLSIFFIIVVDALFSIILNKLEL